MSDRSVASPSGTGKVPDPFTCRREGHVPTLTVTRQNVTTEKDATYITTCRRCGKVYEEAMPDAC